MSYRGICVREVCMYTGWLLVEEGPLPISDYICRVDWDCMRRLCHKIRVTESTVRASEAE
jgi:hypothetical protein